MSERPGQQPSTPPAGRSPPRVPQRARQNLDVVRRFEDSANENVSSTQQVIERVSAFFGSPAYFIFVLAFAVCWIAVDTLGRRLAWPHMEAPPFFWLQGLVSFNALLLTVAVLIRQRRMSDLAQHRAHLDLQINLLTEQKVTKILQLLTSGRNGGADAVNVDDGESNSVEELSKPADPDALLEEIKRDASAS